MNAPSIRRPRFGAVRDVGSGIAAVGVKELRGRMRGRRAFVVLTVHLLLVAGFAWMLESLAVNSYSNGFNNFNGSTSFSASAEIGRSLFIGIISLLTLITLILAPASTAGAISLEREKQTFDLLVTTPISSLAIVLGKLISALSWILLLLLASIPVVALVFTFGGVGPEDVVKAYVVLLATAFTFGAIGLFVSALVKRTQAATVLNLVTVIALTAGTGFIFLFWNSMTGNSGALPDQGGGFQDGGTIETLQRRPPEALMWFNPFVAQVDVMCGTETGFGGSCSVIAGITGNNPNAFLNGAGVANDFGVPHDTYWPRSLAVMLVTALVLIVLSVQLVSPTRRWRLRLPRSRPRRTGSEA
jgi:ABC-type transport system involved in multi-copper enzyme maturation permease subunit